MAHHIFRRGGIPVLVSLESDMSLPMLCSLNARHSEAHQQASIVLQFHIVLRGFGDEQPVDLLYNADNLIASPTALKSSTVSLPQALLDQIARNKGADMRVISLQLKVPCVVRCPRSAGTIAPPKTPDMRFNQLAGLARALRFHILFDYGWLHPLKAARFQQIVVNPESLSALTEETELRQADWTVFDPGADALPSFDAPPPAYEEASKKRLRRSNSPKSPSTPVPKRVLLSPAPIFTLSPTEKATTTTASPSPRPQSSPYAAPPILQEAVNTALASVLPSALQAILPDMLASLIAAPPLSPSSSISTSQLTKQMAPLSSLHHLVRAHLTAHTETLAQQMTTDLIEHANELRNTTDLELQDDLADHRVDVNMLKEDGLRDIDRLFDQKLEDFRESAAGIVESIEDQTLGVYDAARERLDAFVEREKAALAKERAELQMERRRIKHVERAMNREDCAGEIKRAASAPVGW